MPLGEELKKLWNYPLGNILLLATSYGKKDRNPCTSRRISNGVTRSFEFGTWTLILKNITLHIMGVNRPSS